MHLTLPKWKAEFKLIMIMMNYDDDYDKDDVIHVRRNVERIHGIRTSLSFYKKRQAKTGRNTRGKTACTAAKYNLTIRVTFLVKVTYNF